MARMTLRSDPAETCLQDMLYTPAGLCLLRSDQAHTVYTQVNQCRCSGQQGMARMRLRSDPVETCLRGMLNTPAGLCLLRSDQAHTVYTQVNQCLW